MRHRRLSPSLALLLLLSIGVPCAAFGHEGEHWPTPYTAEQIRDAWFDGFWLDTETTTPEGTSVRRTSVFSHSAERAGMRDVALDADGSPVGEAAEFEVTWEELRLHAEFPRAKADRRRYEADTPLGRFSGYLYRVDGENPDEVLEFFFSDEHPGPPLVYRTLVAGEVVYEAKQVARAER